MKKIWQPLTFLLIVGLFAVALFAVALYPYMSNATETSHGVAKTLFSQNVDSIQGSTPEYKGSNTSAFQKWKKRISTACKIAVLGVAMAAGWEAVAQQSYVDNWLQKQTATDPNAFDEKNFRLDLQAYLWPEQTKEFTELYRDHKQTFQNDFTSILRALWKKTTVNGERVDSIEVVQPLIKKFVATLRSFQFEWTQPWKKYQELVKEQNRLLSLWVSLPTSFTESVKIMSEPAMLWEKIIITCDKNGNYMIDKDSREERMCSGDVEVAAATQRAQNATQRAKETWEELRQVTQRADAANDALNKKIEEMIWEAQ